MVKATPIDVFSFLLNETAILNNANVLLDQCKEWFDQNLYFKGTDILSIKEDTDSCQTVSLGLWNHYQKKISTKKNQKSFLEKHFGTSKCRGCNNKYMIPVNLEQKH